MARSLVLAWFALTAGVSGVVSAQVPVMTFDGPSANTYLGRSVAHVGDLDGDGVVDFVCGGTAYLAGKGMVRAYSGRTGSKLFEVVGPKPSTGFGFRVAGAGDVNGDGVPDLLVGTPGYNSAGIEDRGAVWVFSGVDGALVHFLEGDDVWEGRFGWSIAGGADLNHDGFDDFVVGMPGFNNNTGGVRAYSGLTGSALYTVTKDTLGNGGGGALAFVDDIDGDGVPDWATPPGFDSSVRFISGSNGATLFIANVPAQEPKEYFGSSMSSIDDVNGDGFRDLAVGSPVEGYAAILGGTVRVLSGFDGSVLAICAGQHAEQIGQSVAGLKDVNGDGVPDVLTGSTQIDKEKVILFSGATGSRLHEIVSPNFNPLDPLSSNFKFGDAVADLDDINGDGVGDFVVGAGGSHTNGEFSGSVYVYLGGTVSPTVYCTAKQNSAGCMPKIGSKSVASLSVGDQFMVTATKVMSQRIGLLAWSLAPATTPFFGGALCLAPPITRASPQNSGGGSTQSCLGTYSFHFFQSHMTQYGLAAGTSVYAQYWQRDPDHTDGTGVGLTDALNFDIVN